MATSPRYSVPYKRKRMEKTDYRKRLALLKSGKARLVVRKTNTRIIVQLVKFENVGDKTIVNVSNNNLNSYGLSKISNSLPYSYLTGYLAAKLALKSKIKEAVLDLGVGISSKGNKLYAALAGAVAAGLNVPHDEKIFPPMERIKGSHIKGFDTKTIDAVKKSIDEKVGK